MKSVLRLLMLFVVTTSCSAQTQVPEMKGLLGRKAVVQRMPFYKPGTYQRIPSTYAGRVPYTSRSLRCVGSLSTEAATRFDVPIVRPVRQKKKTRTAWVRVSGTY